MFSLEPDFLRTFLAISETGSFGAAGERVNKTQSTVSAQMKRLEEILDVSLFEREGRRNVLTDDGRKLMEYAASIVRLNDEAIKAFQPAKISGSIKIGAIDEYAQAFFPGVLPSFSRSHPGVQVELVTGTSGRLLPQFEEDNLDAIIVSCRPGDEAILPLRSDRLHWIGAEGHTVHYCDPIPIAAWSDGCSWREMALASLAREGRKWRLAFTTSNAALMTMTIRDGLGIGVGPEWLLAPGLKILDDLDAQCPLGYADIGIKRRNNSKGAAALDAFLGHLQGQMKSTYLAA